jgi:endonuclease/exonuclease/phosphatase family metal-dependent hydrolase
MGCTGQIGPIKPVSPIEPQNIRKGDYYREADQRECFQFMTYNIRVGAGTGYPFTSVRNLPSSKKNLEKIAFAIKSVDPEVIALQEVRGSHQARFLAETLNLNYAYSPHGRPSFDWGLALLSKFRILDVSSKVIHQGGDQRIGAVYTIDINGNPSRLINVHYHVGNYEPQVNATMTLLKTAKGPLILMGDFNRPESAHELKPIGETMLDTCNAVDTDNSRHVRMTGTYTGWRHRRIDYIFIDPKSFEVKDVGILPEKHWSASDHIAYFACITPRKPQKDQSH